MSKRKQAKKVDSGRTAANKRREKALMHLSASALKVFGVVSSRGRYGVTDDEGEQLAMMRHQTYSARRRELVLAGLVRDTGTRRETTSGSTARVWVAA